MRAGASAAKFVRRILIVWRKWTRARGLGRGRLRGRLGPGVQLHRDQLPNSTRVVVPVIQVVYLGCIYFSRGSQILPWDGDSLA